MVEHYLAKVGVASSNLVSRLHKKDTDAGQNAPIYGILFCCVIFLRTVKPVNRKHKPTHKTYLMKTLTGEYFSLCR